MEFNRTSDSTEIAGRFLDALFERTDTILFRPIETWQEAGKKRSRVVYKSVLHVLSRPESVRSAVRSLLRVSDEERANVFLGVCPRVGGGGRFDLAWQIRTVRCLWTDIDHVTVEEAGERIAKSGLPTPSIIVNSGNGVHVYWLLEVPYLIDDVGDPPPVDTEWIEHRGRKKPRKYLVEDGERVYLDQRRHASRLSAKAEHLQDVLAGIAKACGGDHTTDLSRLLRLPGTSNRKDQRNGREPVSTALVECDATRLYPLAVFEAIASPALATERARHIQAMPLPRPRKISNSKADKLDQLIAACSIAPAGTRSEADFAMCCYAIRNAVEKDQVWALVEQVGKFAEQGRRYFDLTWDNAEFDVRSAIHDEIQQNTLSKEKQIPRPFLAPAEESEARPTIVVDPQTMPVADTLHEVTNRLLAAGDCFCRTEQLVVINDESIKPILSAAELAGLLNQHVEFFFAKDDAGEYKPLPPAYGNTWLNNWIEHHRLPTINLFTRNPVYTKDWRLVTPGFDQGSGIYYAGQAVEARTGTSHLDALLRDFCFKSPADRTNYIGILLTALLIVRFVGAKSAALFNGNQPGLGKTILAQIIAILRDGHPTETATYNPNDEEFEKRLGAIVRRGATTIIIDNAKGRGRNPRIESACLERCITDPILSFRLLGYSQEIRAENSHIFAITANSADVSPDIVTRSAVINLYHEGNPERRTFSILDPEGYAEEHRVELLGELVGMVERWKEAGRPEANVHSRFNKRGWGNIIGGILKVNGESHFLANAGEAARSLNDTAREFAELVDVLADHSQGTWTASELVEQCSKHGLLVADLGDGSPRSKSTKMGTIAGRFVSEVFTLADGRLAVFHRSEGRKGNVYRVSIEEDVPNLQGFAEPLPNLRVHSGSAH